MEMCSSVDKKKELSDLKLFHSHQTLQQKELLENAQKLIISQLSAKIKSDTNLSVDQPIEGHDVTKEYRTKMTDWMIEVCTSFKCSPRTYFLAV